LYLKGLDNDLTNAAVNQSLTASNPLVTEGQMNRATVLLSAALFIALLNSTNAGAQSLPEVVVVDQLPMASKVLPPPAVAHRPTPVHLFPMIHAPLDVKSQTAISAEDPSSSALDSWLSSFFPRRASVRGDAAERIRWRNRRPLASGHRRVRRYPRCRQFAQRILLLLY